jgi:NAD(P)-dependent dehydrogenase (short-subunit alcohol dehydrogenase family)
MTNPLQLVGRTILVTGASSGIGRATSILLSELGARVVLSGRNAARLEETASAMEVRGHLARPYDLDNSDGIAEWLAGIVAETGALHGLAHCAGVTSLMPLRVLSLKHAAQVMRVNYDSAVALTLAFSKRRMHQPGGSIVLVASVGGLVGLAGSAAYSGSKGAMIAFAKSAALELAQGGVRVNCVAPAYVRTEMYDRNLTVQTPEQLEQRVAAMQPLGLGTPLDVAHAIAFLLADTGRWITGSVLTVDGGYTAQ